MTEHSEESLLRRVDQLNDIGAALSSEKDADKLLEKILLGAKRLTNANAGTLYLVQNSELVFETLRNDTLNLALGGTTGNPITFNPVKLYREDGNENVANVVSYAVLKNTVVNIKDAYQEAGFDFSGTRAVDEKTGYRSKSFLTIPLKNHINETIGCLQLINRMDDTDSSVIIAFDKEDQQLAESLASQAAVTLTNKRLIEEQKVLFEDFIQLIAKAIDEKSAYTGGHCSRVPILALMIADALNDCQMGPLKDIAFDDDEYYELKIAAWLHDCGKVATPEYVMDKSTKLETIYDKIHLVDMRFELLKRDLEIVALRDLLKKNEISTKIADHQLDKAKKNLEDEQDFIRKVNIGGEFLSPEAQNDIASIGERYQWASRDSTDNPLLFDSEIKNLQIQRGTLNDQEREVINNHVTVTLRMLESLQYPKNLARVPDIAGSHHERMDGKGYPRQLTGNEMLLQARILAIADVFEALTAADRPYKPAKTLSESLRILGFMAKEGHIDPDLFDLFIRNQVYLRYAKDYLKAEQIDDITLSDIPGYSP